MILSPSLLSADFGRLTEELNALEQAGVQWAHLDVMDGMFVPNITFGQPVIKSLRASSGLFFDVHLMIEQPERYVADFKAAGADMLVIHAEATRHAQRVLADIRAHGMQAGLAFNPATPLSMLEWLAADVDMVLIMSVNPGFGGQKFLPSTYAKVAEARRLLNTQGATQVKIQVDGGVCPENTAALTRAGADVLVSGSAFFNLPPYAERLALLTRAAQV